MELIFMDYRLALLIIKNRVRLEKLIENNAPFEKILTQSKKLGKYILLQMKYMNKIEVSS